MVPARFVFCPALPLLPSGKIDRAAIRERSAKMPDEIQPEAVPGAVTETERILIGIWERVLGVRPVHRTDHFFTVGGDSLSAVTVILEVEAAFAISLTVRAMFERPTLDGFAERVDRARVQSEGSRNTEFIYPLVEQGRGNPIFFSHVELPLARNGVWKAGCPLYSMTLWAHGKGFASARTIEELARDHIERVRSIQPHGPYRLAGYSFGGLVALEVAQQLQRAGETMELLFLLDPSEPFQSQSKVEPELYEKKRTPGRERLAARIMRHARYLARHPRETVPYVTTRVIDQLIRQTPQGIQEWMCYALVHLHGRSANPLTALLLPKNRWPAFWYVSKRLGQSYVPRPYDGAVLAVFLNDTAGYANWQSLLGPNADVLFVDSDHTGETGLFSAEALAQWLDVLRVRLDVHAKAQS
jgi:thioesterase domain-containing protein/acyl carrier protein